MSSCSVNNGAETVCPSGPGRYRELLAGPQLLLAAVFRTPGMHTLGELGVAISGALPAVISNNRHDQPPHQLLSQALINHHIMFHPPRSQPITIHNSIHNHHSSPSKNPNDLRSPRASEGDRPTRGVPWAKGGKENAIVGRRCHRGARGPPLPGSPWRRVSAHTDVTHRRANMQYTSLSAVTYH